MNRKIMADTKWSVLLGIAGTVTTIILTIYNAYIKNNIDTIEAGIKSRSADLEKSRADIERNTRVLSLFNDMTSEDNKKKNLTIGLISLVLDQNESQKLFSALQSSQDKNLNTFGTIGIKLLQNKPIESLIAQMNENTADRRKAAVAKLESEYKASNQAVKLVLNMFDQRINQLSPSGIINGLYFLSATDLSAWDRPSVGEAKYVIDVIKKRQIGDQTKTALKTLQDFLKNIESRLL